MPPDFTELPYGFDEFPRATPALWQRAAGPVEPWPAPEGIAHRGSLPGIPPASNHDLGCTLTGAQQRTVVFLGPAVGTAVRPQKCREWPLWREVLADPQLAALVRRTCPGITPLADPP